MRSSTYTSILYNTGINSKFSWLYIVFFHLVSNTGYFYLLKSAHSDWYEEHLRQANYFFGWSSTTCYQQRAYMNNGMMHLNVGICNLRSTAKHWQWHPVWSSVSYVFFEDIRKFWLRFTMLDYEKIYLEAYINNK